MNHWRDGIVKQITLGNTIWNNKSMDGVMVMVMVVNLYSGFSIPHVEMCFTRNE